MTGIRTNNCEKYPTQNAACSASSSNANSLEATGSRNVSWLGREFKKIPTSESSWFRVTWYGFFGLLIHGIAFAIYGRFTLNNNYDPQVPDYYRRPVLFLHGVNHNQSGMMPGRNYLREFDEEERHLGSFYSMNLAGWVLNGQEDTFDDYVDKVFDKCVAIYEETGRFPIFVGHSMGGLLTVALDEKLAEAQRTGVYLYRGDVKRVRYLSAEEKRDFRVSDLFTICTSWHGSGFSDRICKLHKKVLWWKAIALWRDMRTDPVRTKSKRRDRLTEIRNYAVSALRRGTMRIYNVGCPDEEFVNQGYFITRKVEDRLGEEAKSSGHFVESTGLSLDLR